MRWEYESAMCRNDPEDAVRVANLAGADGWQLAGTIPCGPMLALLFKRPVVVEAQPPAGGESPIERAETP